MFDWNQLMRYIFCNWNKAIIVDNKLNCLRKNILWRDRDEISVNRFEVFTSLIYFIKIFLNRCIWALLLLFVTVASTAGTRVGNSGGIATPYWLQILHFARVFENNFFGLQIIHFARVFVAFLKFVTPGPTIQNQPARKILATPLLYSKHSRRLFFTVFAIMYLERRTGEWRNIFTKRFSCYSEIKNEIRRRESLANIILEF